jgi:hypothetical protein
VGSKQCRQRFVGALRPSSTRARLTDEALRVVGRVAAHHTDGARLGDVLGDGQQLRHRVEGLAQVILVQPGHDHAHAARGQPGHRRQLGVEAAPATPRPRYRPHRQKVRGGASTGGSRLAVETMWSAAYRVSTDTADLDPLTGDRASGGDQLLSPLNMLPTTTSIQLSRGRTTSAAGLYDLVIS